MFHVAKELLDIDILEMDRTLQYLLRAIPEGGEVQLFLSSDGIGNRGNSRNSESLVCTVDHAQGIILGNGLGALWRRIMRTPAPGSRPSVAKNHEFVIEKLVPAHDDHGSTDDFAVYPVHALFFPEHGQTDLAETTVVVTPEEAHGSPERTVVTSKEASEGQEPTVGKHQTVQAGSRIELKSGGKVSFHWEGVSGLLSELVKFPDIPIPEVDIHQLGLRLSLRSGFDELLSLQTLQGLTPFPHQIRTVERVLRRMRGRALLCDEVGLGKTVEAGIILLEYILRGLVRRVLILTPPSLVEQWKEEVTRKFGLPFVCYDDVRFKAESNPWLTNDHIIASIDTAKRERHREQILVTEFDLVIVDEAHHLKNRNTLAWKFVNQLKKKYILLLTATPIENSMEELFNLITLLRPGQLHTEAEYKRKYVNSRDPLKPKNVDELKRVVQSVMIRNRRSTTGVIQAGRTADTFIVDPDDMEQRFYAGLSEFVKSQLSAAKDRQGAFHPFVLKSLLHQAGSSAACTIPTLRKLRSEERGLSASVVEQIVELEELSAHMNVSAKMTHLQRLLEAAPDQTLVFTGFVETQKAITHFLSDHGIHAVEFHGGMSRTEKEQSIHQFREGAPVLVSTESGGEGRNLQFCHRMINFDIPWNPMRIEQRIGRIHRIGQEHEVNIYNLVARGTMEEHILHILDAKINMFQLVVGELDMILGSLENRRDFEDVLMNIWVQAHDEADFAQLMDEFGNELLTAKAHYQKVRDIDDTLLSELIDSE